MSKKAIVVGFAALVAASGFAHPGRGPHFGPRRAPVVYHGHSHGWGRGGRNFWPGFVGGLAGGVLANTLLEPRPVVVTTPVVAAPAVVSTPVVVAAPTVVQTVPVTTVQNVWVEGRYVDQVQANGAVVRVWVPGHYEQRTVTVQ